MVHAAKKRPKLGFSIVKKIHLLGSIALNGDKLQV